MNERYEQLLKNSVIKLEAVVEKDGLLIEKVDNIIRNKNIESTRIILKEVESIVNSNNYPKEAKLLAKNVNDTLFMFIGYSTVKNMLNANKSYNSSLSLSQLIDSLDSLVGLNNVKKQVKDLVAFQMVNQKRIATGLASTKRTMHLAFTGNPGTGKTTVARIIGQMYRELGFLSKGHFIEVSRTDLIAGYQGQTALKVKSVIDEAKGGVLFIDEAYSITENDHTDSYGRECLTELTKALEDYRDDLVVIVAGYTEPMEKFFDANPGLKSRFNTFIEFDDYSSEQLLCIFNGICKENDYDVDEKLSIQLLVYFKEQIKNKEDNFSNGRLARNIFEKLIMNHARRLVEIDVPSKEQLRMITIDDYYDL